MQAMRGAYGSARELYNDRGASWQTDPPHITKFWFHKQTSTDTPYEWSDNELNTYASETHQKGSLPIVEDVQYPTFLWEEKDDEYQFDLQVRLHKDDTWHPATLFAKKSDSQVGGFGGFGGVNPWEFRMQANFGFPYDTNDQPYVCRPSPIQQGADAERERTETDKVSGGTHNILWETEREVLQKAIRAAEDKIQKEQADVENAKAKLAQEQEDVATAEAKLAQEQENVKNAKAKLAQEQEEAQTVEKTEENTRKKLQNKLTTELSTSQELKAERRQDEMFGSKKIRTFVPSQELRSLLNSGSRAYYRALALGQTVDGIS